MRRATRRDENHAAVVAELRARGYGVTDFGATGAGVGDFYESRPGQRGLFVECKNPATRPTKPRGASNAAKLARQAAFRELHPGCVVVATSAEDVVRALASEADSA